MNAVYGLSAAFLTALLSTGLILLGSSPLWLLVFVPHIFLAIRSTRLRPKAV